MSAELGRTSAVELLSCEHSRMRRAQRLIEKRDLQAALKYGKREHQTHPKTGRITWKITYADVVFICDETLSREITCWALPGAGLDVEPVNVTTEMQRAHRDAVQTIRRKPEAWTSHTVVVVDQSGSMRKSDVMGGATRSDAVWLTLAVDYVAKQLETKNASSTDMMSIVSMNDEASVLIDQQPTDWMLYNAIIALLRSKAPMMDGNYLPALNAAEVLLMQNTTSSCALQLFFLSDGRPSDNLPRSAVGAPERQMFGITAYNYKMQAFVSERIEALASRFGRRLTVKTVGFGPAGYEDFRVLRSMASRCEKYGSVGDFMAAGLSPESLGLALSSLRISLTSTRAELTETDGSSQRKVRDVRREARDLEDDTSLTDKWHLPYRNVQRLSYVRRDGRFQWTHGELQSTLARCVAIRKLYFGEGAERLVRKFREVTAGGEFVGPMLVAKEGRFINDIDHLRNKDVKDFHRKFCETQARAQELAYVFNSRLGKLPGVNHTVPRVSFLECSVYMVSDTNYGRIGVLVEKQLDVNKYRKWNDNKGAVEDIITAVQDGGNAPLDAIEESEGEEEEDEEEEPTGASTYRPQDADIPQAFSHFTYRYTKRRMLVCDLQGVLTPASAIAPSPKFEFTDPVIHYSSRTGRSSVFGRTDRGKRGQHDFFKTHECTELCRMLNRKWVRRATGELQAEDDVDT